MNFAAMVFSLHVLYACTYNNYIKPSSNDVILEPIHEKSLKKLNKYYCNYSNFSTIKTPFFCQFYKSEEK
jgi:hypothetical protein